MNWVAIGLAAAGPPVFALVISPALTRKAAGARWWSPLPGGGDWALGGVGLCLGFAVGGSWVPAAIAAVHIVIGLWLWWWDRRNRKRAPRAYGAKSRARIAALVATLRERARPRPVLRPVPGGVR